MRLYSLTSDLHGEFTSAARHEKFIKDIEAALGESFEYRDTDFSDYCGEGDVIYVRTGGTEGLFRKQFCRDGVISVPGRVRLLTSGKSNSLAASMEILSYLCQNGVPGEIIHGSPKAIAASLRCSDPHGRIASMREPLGVNSVLSGKRLGVVGKPSDWLISSDVDYAKAKEVLGVELVDIPMEELLEEIAKDRLESLPELNPMNDPKFGKPISEESFRTSMMVYSALRRIQRSRRLDGLSVRCFDLLSTVGNTGCMALAILNSEGVVGTCEGDIPTMISMAVGQAVTGTPGFQVNLSSAEDDTLLFAHCTVPLSIVEKYSYDTHFESGIGVAVHGELPSGPATILKIGSGLDQFVVQDVELVRNQYENNLCRTQVIVRGSGLRDYLLNEPLGNHHVIFMGHHAAKIREALGAMETFWPRTYDRILSLLGREVKPALGCTEPIAVAIAVARAAAEWPGQVPERVEVRVSPNILKNAMGVGIPGTGATGLPIATALAAICGRWEYGLEVLKDVNPGAVSAAKIYVSEGRVKVGIAETDRMLYAEAECFYRDGHTSKAAIRDEHDSICYVSRDGETVLEVEASAQGEQHDDGKFLSLAMIEKFAKTVSLDDLGLMREQVCLNTALANEGLYGQYGLSVGRVISDDPTFGDDLSRLCMCMTAAASDARMAGCPRAAMSNSGSGNQGITVSMPVIAAAKYMKSKEEDLLRALVLSNLVAIHIKSYLGRLSALCGCVVASTGAACGIVMLKGGTREMMAAAIKNMIGSITGMVCDGAKEGCAMKVASGVSCALQSAVLAMKGICVQPTDGIIDSDIEKTIRNLGTIGSRGMKQTDDMILNIMICK